MSAPLGHSSTSPGDTARSVLITGASSGIGLAMLRRVLEDRDVARVFGVSRSASRSDALGRLRKTHGERLIALHADITGESALAKLCSDVSAHTPTLDWVINAAGLLHDDTVQPEKSLEQITQINLERVFALNAFAPILLARALMPLLCRGQAAVFASLSARVGSIGDNRSGGWYAYRASKAAQNQLMKTLAIELARRNPNACCLVLHPGTVDTPLSSPFQARVPPGKLFTADRAAAQLLAIIAGSTARDTGRFIAWDGADIPW
jgi:NAD(P)-dependent dehydrogenase (short-subunit alcohol dehydrogenase family)